MIEILLSLRKATNRLIANYENTISTNSKGHYSLIFGQTQYNPSAFRIADISYFTAQWNKENNYQVNLYSFDHVSKALSGPYNWGTDTGDYHSNGNIINNSSDYLIVTNESGHNASIVFKISDTPKNITSYTLQSTYSSNSPAYPNLMRLSNRIFCVFRSSLTKLMIIYSDDNCQTWSTALSITQPDGATWQYPKLIYNESKLKLVINKRTGGSGYFTTSYYLESTDGVTWTNAAGGFSKNIDTVGAITTGELNTYCLVYSNGTTTDYLITCSLSQSTNAYLIGNDNASGSVRFYYYSSGWLYKTITLGVITLSDNSKTVIYEKGGYLNIITLYLNGSSKRNLIKIYSNDLFDSYNYEIITDNDLEVLNPSMPNNFNETLHSIFLINANERTSYGSGDIIDPDNSYSDMYLKEL